CALHSYYNIVYSAVIFFFNCPATTEIYTLSLHDALPISGDRSRTHASQAGADGPAGGAPGRPVGRAGTRPGQVRAVLSGRAAQITLPPFAVCSTSQTPPASRVISRTSSRPRPPVRAWSVSRAVGR